ncbi:MAG: hypothetical protein EOO89_09880 [Pedobacter sp.]|nr:MAG: hypothetical protein EOO89_09880 [Pedobacter sp.]
MTSFRKSSKQGEKGISAFLNWWEEEGYNKNLPSPETANAIQVMTIHKAKGLAFRAVLIPFCDWSLGGRADTFWVPVNETPYAGLDTIPLQYSSKLKGSSVAHYYLEELLFNYMDALNNLYVATTRAKDYIYISIPGKKTRTVSNIGDAVLETFAEEFGADNNEVQFGNFSAIGDEQNIVSKLDLAVYPTTNRMEEVYEETEQRHQKYIDNITRSGKKGSNLHLILAEANKIEDAPVIIDRLIMEGLILEDEKTLYIQQVASVLANPALKVLLDQHADQVNEISIIGVDGKTYRPDKLIINGQQVSIIDYKFTSEEHPSHIDQILNYRSLLEAMGYKEVKTYLFYAAKAQLIEIK